jgi:hypothetical protein
MSGYEQYDYRALMALWEHGAMTTSQLVAAIDIDQFSEREAREWIPDAGARGLIETTGGSGEATRYNITDKGREQIGKPSGR